MTKLGKSLHSELSTTTRGLTPCVIGLLTSELWSRLSRAHAEPTGVSVYVQVYGMLADVLGERCHDKAR